MGCNRWRARATGRDGDRRDDDRESFARTGLPSSERSSDEMTIGHKLGRDRERDEGGSENGVCVWKGGKNENGNKKWRAELFFLGQTRASRTV